MDMGFKTIAMMNYKSYHWVRLELHYLHMYGFAISKY